MHRVGNHPNIVSLLGVARLENPTRLGIVTNFMGRGSLDRVLQKGDVSTRNMKRLVYVAMQIGTSTTKQHFAKPLPHTTIFHHDTCAHSCWHVAHA